MVNRSYIIPLVVILEASTLSSQQPYAEFISFFQKNGVTYREVDRRYIMTASVLLPPKTPDDSRLRELSFFYQPGNLNERYFIFCEGLVEPTKSPNDRGPFELGSTSADCYLDGIFGIFDQLPDAKLYVVKRGDNVAVRLRLGDGFRQIPPEEQEAATKKQRELLETMMSNWKK